MSNRNVSRTSKEEAETSARKNTYEVVFARFARAAAALRRLNNLVNAVFVLFTARILLTGARGNAPARMTRVFVQSELECGVSSVITNTSYSNPGCSVAICCDGTQAIANNDERKKNKQTSPSYIDPRNIPAAVAVNAIRTPFVVGALLHALTLARVGREVVLEIRRQVMDMCVCV